MYDVLLVVGARPIGMSDITKAARQLKLPEEKLLGDWIACIPGFTLDKYRRLQRSRLSIIAMNCFGGIISNTLGLPFRSPFVNLALPEEDFVRFMRHPRTYMEEQPIFKETRFEHNLKRDYPVVTIGNVDIRMNHDTDFDEAVAKWNKRKPRINWYNLFIVMCTKNKEILEQFDALPHGKKICFVPFKSDLDSAWYINPEIDPGAEITSTGEKSFINIVNRFGSGHFFYYDVFDMLLYGKKTQLIKM